MWESVCDLKTGVTPPEYNSITLQEKAYMHWIPNKRPKQLGFYGDLGEGQKGVEAALL